MSSRWKTARRRSTCRRIRGRRLWRSAQLVHTLTQFPDIERVVVESGKPVTRKAFESAAPQILIESPLDGDVVSSPIRLRGHGERVRGDGVDRGARRDRHVVLEAFTTATSGTGTRGTFDTEPRPPGSERHDDDHRVRVVGQGRQAAPRSRRPGRRRTLSYAAGTLPAMPPVKTSRRQHRARGAGTSCWRPAQPCSSSPAWSSRASSSAAATVTTSETTATTPGAAGALFEGIPQDGAVLGSPDAEVTMIQFEDLQCPVCKTLPGRRAAGDRRGVRPAREREAALRRARVHRAGFREGPPPRDRGGRAGKALAVRRRALREPGRRERGLGDGRAAGARRRRSRARLREAPARRGQHGRARPGERDGDRGASSGRCPARRGSTCRSATASRTRSARARSRSRSSARSSTTRSPADGHGDVSDRTLRLARRRGGARRRRASPDT